MHQVADEPTNEPQNDTPAPPSNEELNQLKEQLANAQQQLEQASGLRRQVATMFDPRAGEGDRAAALAQVMAAGGLHEQDVATILSDITDESPETPVNEPQPNQQQQPDPSLDAINELRAQVEGLQKSAENHSKAESKRLLQRSIAEQFEQSPDTKDILSTIESVRGKEHADKVREFLRKDVMRETLESLYQRRQQVGSFDNAWIEQEAAKAAKVVLEKARAMGVSDGVGKAPTESDDMVLLSEIAKKDVKPPVFDKDKDRNAVHTDVDNYTVQRLQQIAARAAANQAAGGDTKA